MAFENPLLARLFGKMARQEEPEPAQEEEKEAQAPPPEPPKPPPELQLPPEHPMNRLWSMYHAGHPDAPSPLLCMEGRENDPPEEVHNEFFQLQTLLSITAKKRLELARPKQAEGEEPQVPDLDAQAVVFVPRSALSAWVLVYPPMGDGAELEREELTQALEREQVCFGLENTLLDSLPQRPDRYFHLFPAAWGQPPAHGADGQAVELFPRTAERKLTVDDNNRVDYTSLDMYHNVEAGGVICRIIPPAEGLPGRSVKDEELPAKDGRPASVPMGRNTRVNDEGDALVATIAGQVEFSGRTFQVRPLLEIGGDVDFSTGSINFLGDVHIRGDIREGFTVRAMGSITVDGVVEACTVEAGTDLVVARGVQGDNQAVIRAQRNIFAKYLENCCVCVKDTLHTDCIINCDVYCDGMVEVRSGRMTVIGGTLRAGREVSAGIIGSRTEARTDVILGGLPCGDFDYGLLQKEIGDLKAEIERTAIQPESPQKLSTMGKLKVKLLVAQKKLDQLDKERDQLSEEEDQSPGVRRMLCDTVYPGTNLTIDGVSYQFDRKLFPCAATLSEGEIRLA